MLLDTVYTSTMSKYIYMAGLLDGEGTIGIARNRGPAAYRSPYISVSSTTPEIIEWLVENFGGRACKQRVRNDRWKESWSWRVTSWSDIENILTNVLPHMLEPEKIRRGNLLLTEYKSVTVRNGKYTDEQRERKLDFEARFLSP